MFLPDFISKSMTYLGCPDVKDIDLPGVFELASTMGKDLGESEDLAHWYLNIEPDVWMKTGGDPFWSVLYKINSTGAESDKRYWQSSLSPLIDRIEIVYLNQAPINKTLMSYMLCPDTFEIIRTYMPISTSVPIGSQLAGLSNRSRFLMSVEEKLEFIDDIDVDRQHIKDKKNELRRIQVQNIKSLLGAHMGSEHFSTCFKQQFPHLSEHFLHEILDVCFDHLGEDKARILIGLYDSENPNFDNKVLTDRVVARFADTDPNKVMAQLRVLGHHGLGGDVVSRSMGGFLTNFKFERLAPGKIDQEQGLAWIRFVVDQIGKDSNLEDKEWPIRLWVILSRIHKRKMFDEIESRDLIDQCLDVLIGFINKNKESMRAYIDSKAKTGGLFLLVIGSHFPWPTDEIGRKEVIRMLAETCVTAITKPEHMKERGINQLFRRDRIDVPKDLVVEMGQNILNLMTKVSEKETLTFDAGAAECVTRYLNNKGLSPKEKFDACRYIVNWNVQKNVLTRLNLPPALYHELNRDQRGDMLAQDLAI